MIDIDWMVLRLVQLVQNTHIAPYLRCCAEHSQPELFFIYSLRATESEQYSARTNHLNRLRINPLIAAKRVLYRISVLGKSRRIQYDQIVRMI